MSILRQLQFFQKLNIEDEKESCICVCNINGCGKSNLIRVLCFVKIFTGESVKLGELGYKDIEGKFSGIGSGVHGQR